MAAKILIDAISMSHPQPGGYRTYTTNLVQHLQLIEQRYEYVEHHREQQTRHPYVA